MCKVTRIARLLLIAALVLVLAFILINCGGGGGGGGGDVGDGRFWTYPSSLASFISVSSVEGASGPQAAMDATGNTLVTWIQNDGSVQRVYKSEYRSGVWTHPTTTSDAFSLTGSHSYGQQAAVDDNGNAIVVWVQSATGIYKSEYRSGVWTHPTTSADRINPVGTTDANVPRVAMDNNGNAIIVWQQSDGANTQVYLREYRNSAWSTAPTLTTRFSFTGWNAGQPDVAMDNNGNAIVVWHQSNGTNTQIYKREYRGGNWSAVPAVTSNISPAGQDAFGPRVAMDDLGTAVITWSQRNGTMSMACGSMGFPGPCSAIYMSEYRNSVWTHPSTTVDHISPTADTTVAYSSVPAMDGNGNAIIAWAQSDGSSQCTTGLAMSSPCTSIFKSEYRSGIWTHPTTTAQHISPTGNGILADSPAVAMDSSGNAIISWTGYDGSSAVCSGFMPCSQVYKSEFRNNSWSHPSGLADNISPDGNVGGIGLAMGDNGDAIIVWSESDESGSQPPARILKSERR
jgi:hypothetical protein